MHKTIRAATLAFGTLALAGLSANANADSYNFYNDSAGDGSISGSYPQFIITGSNNGSGGDTAYYTETVPAGETSITFTWQYTTADSYGAVEDPGGYVLGDTLYTLSKNAEDPGTIDSGTVTLSLTPGETFGFFVDSVDSQGGAAMLAINESLPATPPPPPPPAIPEPQNAVLLMAGLAALFAAVRRRQSD